ncbi:hypothetical protein DYB30_003933 [Aphanomyces astaci]|uniref:Glutamine-dependent asparagine synthetase n=2 Tax=Aphanomyces astaci TaxID=112090 RepID=A0A397DKM0_APHAT|nr:hypothetical protein DYB30_003933 [Aphanomyces astaci]RHY65698.1 hypothetical protein DYB34_001503 [Aphanomyces astaci]
MCGIWGLYRTYCSPANPQPHDDYLTRSTTLRLQQAHAKLVHRGPDSTSQLTVETPSMSLAVLQTRLAIVDPLYSSPHPFSCRTDDDHEIFLVCNGEVYNHRTLRAAIPPGAYSFQSHHCDIEVILASIHLWGLDAALAALDGMFAFMLVQVDAATGDVDKIICARDPFGIKPLFVATTATTLECASEMKAACFSTLMENERLQPTLDEVPAGSYMVWHPTRDGGLGPAMTQRYFSPPWSLGSLAMPLAGTCQDDVVPRVDKLKPSIKTNVEDVVADEVADELLGRLIRTALEQAVVKRLGVPWERNDDVELTLKDADDGCEVGVFLSGGLDSSLIAAIATRKLPSSRQLKTFTIYCTDNAEGEEGGKPSGSNSECWVGADRDMARKVSNAIGSDHFEYAFTPLEAQAALPDVIYHMETSDKRCMRAGLAMYLLSQRLRQHHPHLKVVLCGEGADELFAGYDLFRQFQRACPLGSPTAADDKIVLDFERELTRRLMHIGSSELLRVDRCTMAFGLEARVPFLDLHVVHVAMQCIFPQQKMLDVPDRLEKQVLRLAFQGYGLPPDVLGRRKVEFAKGFENQSWIPGDEEHAYATHFSALFPPSVASCVRRQHARRQQGADEGPSIRLTIVQVDLFLSTRLHLDLTKTSAPPTPELLHCIVEAMHKHIPFHNLTLLTRPRRPPSWDEIVHDMMMGLGGPCAVVNAFLHALLTALQFQVSFRAATIAGRTGCHVCLVCELDSTLIFVDCGNAKPYMPCALDDTTTHEVGDASWAWRLITQVVAANDEPSNSPHTTTVVSVQHRQRAKCQETATATGGRDEEKIERWETAMTFDAYRPVPYSFFRASIVQSRSDPRYGPFLTGVRLVRYPGLALVAIRDRTMRCPEMLTPKIATTSAELTAFVQIHFGDIPALVRLFDKALACVALF